MSGVACSPELLRWLRFHRRSRDMPVISLCPKSVLPAGCGRYAFQTLELGHLLREEASSEGLETMTVESKPAADASIGELMSQLSAQTSRLVRDELRLAQKEFQESAKHAGIGAGLFSLAGLLALVGFVTLVAAAVAALSLVLPVWAAAVIVAAVLFLVAGFAALIGKRQADEVTPAAPKTVETVKADIEEVKEARHGRT